MVKSLTGTGSVHHSVNHISPRPAMRSDGPQLFTRMGAPPSIPFPLIWRLGKWLPRWRRWRPWVGGEAWGKESKALQTGLQLYPPRPLCTELGGNNVDTCWNASPVTPKLVGILCGVGNTSVIEVFWRMVEKQISLSVPFKNREINN